METAANLPLPTQDNLLGYTGQGQSLSEVRKETSDEVNVALVLDEGCRDMKAGKACGGRDSVLQGRH